MRVGEGLPVFGEECKFGDLIIRFDIKFPTALNDKEKDILEKALNE